MRFYTLAMIQGEPHPGNGLSMKGRDQVAQAARLYWPELVDLCEWSECRYPKYGRLDESAEIFCGLFPGPGRIKALVDDRFDILPLKDTSAIGEKMFGSLSNVNRKLHEEFGDAVPMREYYKAYPPLLYVAGLYEGLLKGWIEERKTATRPQGLILFTHKTCAESLCHPVDPDMPTLGPAGAVVYEWWFPLQRTSPQLMSCRPLNLDD